MSSLLPRLSSVVSVLLLLCLYGSHHPNAIEITTPCNTTVDVSTAYTRTEFRRRIVDNASALGAVCNDFTPAVYYVSKAKVGGELSRKWIVFLESGSGCASVSDCNKRYYEKRELMSSANFTTDKFEIINGTDLFDARPQSNPDYYNYNFVLIPYCSSDLWLGQSNWSREEIGRNFLDTFNVSDGRNHFAFRGLFIFRTIIQELKANDGFTACKTQDVVLAGSSAGGLGVLNHADWLKEQLTGVNCPQAKFSAILDSSWFINFDNNIVTNFNFSFLERETNYDRHAPCQDRSVGYPCCVSARCMLTKQFFPSVPIFSIFSLYDLYIIAGTVRNLEEKLDSKSDLVKYAEMFRAITEYGGAMNFSLDIAQHMTPNLSYFVPSCLQHVYLATSSLWLPGEGGLFNGSMDTSNFNDTLGNTKFFRHLVRDSTWKKVKISRNETGSVSLQCALHRWNRAWRGLSEEDKYPIRWIDDCFGARCNQFCVEEVLLGILNGLWDDWVGFLLDAIVLFVGCMALLFKAVMMVRKKWLIEDQRRFLDWDKRTKRRSRQLPFCSEEEAIGIACMNLMYSVQLTPQAYAQAKKIQEQKLAAEEEGREMMGMTTDEGGPSISRSSTREFNQGDGAVGRFFKRLFCCSGSSNCKSGDQGNYTDMLTQDVESGHANGNGNGVSTQNGHGVSTQNGYVRSAKKGYKLKKEKSWDGPLDVPREKGIINGISGYFNPGQLVAIMGPSGCGKTTFLDLMTGRRKDHTGNEIFINGSSFASIKEWYIRHTGYVLQLAIPYYEELTVRQNLTLAAFIRLPSSMTAEEKFERVEQVIEETGLASLKDTVVGGSLGGGLSGGQKRRLCVAIQLLNMPKVIFLDEPTSGLDAASSMELLQHLSYVSKSGRMVLLTIHQPRLEIFHMFDVILFLCQGQVAYYGTPMEAPALFLKAYHFARLEGDAPSLDMANKNPADVIMDILGSERYRAAILDYYSRSYEPKAVKNAIKKARRSNSLTYSKPGSVEEDSGWQNRYFILETRAAMRSSLAQSLYLPLIFVLYAFVLGTAYFQAGTPLLIMAAFCVFSFASSIFMFPAVFPHLSKAIEMFKLEKADGVGYSFEILLQTFLRFVAMSFFPLIVCTLILYLMVLGPQFWNFMDIFQVTVFSLALNQVWIALAIMLVCLFPSYGHKISPLMSCAAGFAGGFLIPKPQMKVYYSWLFYVNPNFYGYSSMMRFIMPKIDIGCGFNSTVECFPTTGEFWLEHFGFQHAEPFFGLLIIMIMTAAALVLGWLFLEKDMSGMSVMGIAEKWWMGKKRRKYESDVLKEEDQKPPVEEEEVISLQEFNVRTPSEASDNETAESVVGSDEDILNTGETILQRFQGHKILRKRHKDDIKHIEEEYHNKPGRVTLERQATRSHLMATRQHSVFAPGQSEEVPSTPLGMSRQSFRRMSRRDRRKVNAQEIQERQKQMMDRIEYYNRLQRQLEVNENDVDGFDHDMIDPNTVKEENIRKSLYRCQKKKVVDRQRRRSLPNTAVGVVKKSLTATRSFDPSGLNDWHEYPAGADIGRRGSEQSSIDFNNMQPGSASDLTVTEGMSPKVGSRSLGMALKSLREEDPSFARPHMSPLISREELCDLAQPPSILKKKKLRASQLSSHALTPDYEPGGGTRDRYLRFAPPFGAAAAVSSSGSEAEAGGYDVTDIERRISVEPKLLSGLRPAEESLSSSSSDEVGRRSPMVIRSRKETQEAAQRPTTLGLLKKREMSPTDDWGAQVPSKTRVVTPVIVIARPSIDEGDKNMAEDETFA
eukprot:m.17345 g.17345  ORF g.17345 m.17345 type:complete len:1779 (+) comp27452_c0_seq1:72-5408(+)